MTNRSCPATAGNAVLLVAACLTLSACTGPRQLASDSVDYAEAYADSSNRQLLMNLARRDNGHPAYFLQLGAISATYVHSSSATASVAHSRTRVSPGSAGVVSPLDALTTTLAPTGSLALTRTEQPTFSFTPLAGKTFAGALLNPIGAEIFFGMLDQGLHADQLLRTLVQAVTFHWPESKYTKVVVNVPDEERFEEYRDFLRLAGLMRELQRRRLLVTRTVTDASGKSSTALAFTDSQAIGEFIANNPDHNYLADAPPGAIRGQPQISFSFRTFDGVLAALATEHQVFDLLAATRKGEFLDQIPSGERRPILRTRWDDFDGVTSPAAVQVDYRGQLYEIKDPIGGGAGAERGERNRWNREVFIVLTHLFAVISLDPGDLPAQQLIQIQ